MSAPEDQPQVARLTTTTTITVTTEYVVLNKDGEGWKPIVPTVKARSAEHAIREAAGNTPGNYVAVPARSWKPVKVSVDTVPTVKLEDA